MAGRDATMNSHSSASCARLDPDGDVRIGRSSCCAASEPASCSQLSTKTRELDSSLYLQLRAVLIKCLGGLPTGVSSLKAGEGRGICLRGIFLSFFLWQTSAQGTRRFNSSRLDVEGAIRHSRGRDVIAAVVRAGVRCCLRYCCKWPSSLRNGRPVLVGGPHGWLAAVAPSMVPSTDGSETSRMNGAVNV